MLPEHPAGTVPVIVILICLEPFGQPGSGGCGFKQTVLSVVVTLVIEGQQQKRLETGNVVVQVDKSGQVAVAITVSGLLQGQVAGIEADQKIEPPCCVPVPLKVKAPQLICMAILVGMHPVT
ncbi:MAG: hypothetical protein AB1458_05970 [Bacteroidota bacterium]